MQQSHVTEALSNYLNTHVKAYLNQSLMHKDWVWATDAEIIATSMFLNYDVIVYGKYGNQLEWLRYP